MTTSAIDMRRASDRFHTRAGWLDSKHSFSFGNHRDRTNTNHGRLLVLNDDRVASGRIEVPEAAYGHVFVARGSGELEANGRLDTGDAVRLTGVDGLSFVADHEGAEMLIWTTGALR